MVEEYSLHFGNDFARKLLIFDVDNRASRHVDNQQNNVLVLGEGSTDSNYDSTDAAETK